MSTTLTLHGSPVATIFDLLGHDENDMTASLGWRSGLSLEFGDWWKSWWNQSAIGDPLGPVGSNAGGFHQIKVGPAVGPLNPRGIVLPKRREADARLVL